MTTIVVIGANGQVGAEVCLLLSQMPDVRVVPVVRSRYAASFLHRCGLESRIGSIGDPAAAPELLADADVIADFARPTGLPSVVKAEGRRNVHACVRNAPTNATYVFMSTTMAYGMAASEGRYRSRLVSRTTYSAQKRDAERHSRFFGLIYRRPVYVFRLGEVHGELQAVSQQLMSTVGSRPVLLPHDGEVPSDTLFCSTIALALLHVAQGLDPPGMYTVLESPEWTLRQRYEFYARELGTSLTIVGENSSPAPGWSQRLASQALALIGPRRELLTAHLLPPQFEQRVKLPYLARRAASEVTAAERRLMDAPQHLHGPVPGPRLRLPHTGLAMEDARRRVRDLLRERLGPRGPLFGNREPKGTADL